MDPGRVEIPAEQAGIHKEAATEPRILDETILVVEDDDAVRAMISQALRAEGWRVLTATDGEDALTAAGDHAAPIAAVIADIYMPRLSGMKLLEQLRGWYPSLPFLFISGLSPTPKLLRETTGSKTAFLAKPFGVDELVAAVADLIERSEREH